MSLKLFLHTVFCFGLVGILAIHISAGRRRVVFSALLLAALCLGLAPWAYKLFGIGPRLTIHWAQLVFIGAQLLIFTPARGRQLAVMQNEFDQPQATEPAPLRAVK